MPRKTKATRPLAMGTPSPIGGGAQSQADPAHGMRVDEVQYGGAQSAVAPAVLLSAIPDEYADDDEWTSDPEPVIARLSERDSAIFLSMPEEPNEALKKAARERVVFHDEDDAVIALMPGWEKALEKVRDDAEPIDKVTVPDLVVDRPDDYPTLSADIEDAEWYDGGTVRRRKTPNQEETMPDSTNRKTQCPCGAAITFGADDLAREDSGELHTCPDLPADSLGPPPNAERTPADLARIVTGSPPATLLIFLAVRTGRIRLAHWQGRVLVNIANDEELGSVFETGPIPGSALKLWGARGMPRDGTEVEARAFVESRSGAHIVTVPNGKELSRLLG